MRVKLLANWLVFRVELERTDSPSTESSTSPSLTHYATTVSQFTIFKLISVFLSFCVFVFLLFCRFLVLSFCLFVILSLCNFVTLVFVLILNWQSPLPPPSWWCWWYQHHHHQGQVQNKVSRLPSPEAPAKSRNRAAPHLILDFLF